MAVIYLGGVAKADVKRLLDQRHDANIRAIVSSDMEAGPILKRTPGTYYIGTCHTGAGGSLGAMLAFLGRQNCHTFGRQARLTVDNATQLLAGGVRAFGLSVDQIAAVVPPLVDAIAAYQSKGEPS